MEGTQVMKTPLCFLIFTGSSFHLFLDDRVYTVFDDQQMGTLMYGGGKNKKSARTIKDIRDKGSTDLTSGLVSLIYKG